MNNFNRNLNIFKSPVKVKGDTSHYRTWFLEQDWIKSAEITSLKLESSEEKTSGNTILFQNEDAMEAYLAKEYGRNSLIYATKAGGYRMIKVNEIGKNQLLNAMGVEITHDGFAVPQKLVKRLKRLFRQSRYGFWNRIRTVTHIPDPERNWDGIGFISIKLLKSLGIKAEEGDRFSSTVVFEGGNYKDHLLAENIATDLILFSRPAKELSFPKDMNFLQLEPVSSNGDVHMDVQSLTGLLMKKLLSPEEIVDMIIAGLKSLDTKLIRPIEDNDCTDVDSKLVRLGLHEVSVLFPRIVSMRWSSERKSLLKFSKFRFPVEGAIKGYATCDYEIVNSLPVLKDGNSLSYRNGNLLVPKSMISAIKKMHGGCDWDDAFILIPKDGKYIVYRNPNYFAELAKYDVIA